MGKVTKSDQQKGVVMVMVLSIVVLMVTLMALLVEEQHLLIRQVSNQRVSEQGYQYAQGVNAWAARVLNDDKNRDSDHLQEKWAKFGRPPPPATEEEGFSLDLTSQQNQEEEPEPKVDFGIDTLEVTIDDLQGRYNLNNLVREGKIEPQQKLIFINLLEQLEIGDYDLRERLYGALVDWLDENDFATANGVESPTYRSKDTPYFAGDQTISGLGELKFIEGFDKDTIRKLKPYVTFLPNEFTKININTAPIEVLAALNSSPPVVDLGQLTLLLARREEPGFQGFQRPEIVQFENAIIATSAARSRNSVIPGMLQVTSQFFQINVKVELGDSMICTRTLVVRENVGAKTLEEAKVKVLRQEQDTLCLEETVPTNGSDEAQDDDISKT